MLVGLMGMKQNYICMGVTKSKKKFLHCDKFTKDS